MPTPIFVQKKFMGMRKVNKKLKGMPDLMLIANGKFVGIEFKSAKGKQREDQVRWEREINQAGGTYILARSLDEVITLLKTL